jgi:hypothetical protein
MEFVLSDFLLYQERKVVHKQPVVLFNILTVLSPMKTGHRMV